MEVSLLRNVPLHSLLLVNIFVLIFILIPFFYRCSFVQFTFKLASFYAMQQLAVNEFGSNFNRNRDISGFLSPTMMFNPLVFCSVSIHSPSLPLCLSSLHFIFFFFCASLLLYFTENTWNVYETPPNVL